MRLKKTLTLSLQKKSLAEKSLNTAIMDADAAIGQSMEIFDEIQQQEQINNFTTNICLTQENQKKQKCDSHIYPFDYLSNGSYW